MFKQRYNNTRRVTINRIHLVHTSRELISTCGGLPAQTKYRGLSIIQPCTFLPV